MYIHVHAKHIHLQYTSTRTCTCTCYHNVHVNYLAGLDEFGWTRNSGQLEIVWEAEEKAKDRVDYILNGCKCKTGCRSKRCKCKKKERMCGPGCQCINCVNAHHGGEGWDEGLNQLEVEGQEENKEADEYIEESVEEEMEIYEDEETNVSMSSVFGEEEDDY